MIHSIHAKTKLLITYSDQERGKIATCECAPLDVTEYTEGNKLKIGYQFWNYDGIGRGEVLYIHPKQILAIINKNEQFCPSEFVDWIPNWILPRDWGIYS
ncbi:hypothetical protein SAMN04488136_11646 [Vibrio xiamenensis]|uniref:WYL domain-containing protein n=2 Tax=Vibrio xiamenensis TaxID=861298 RepID=A0A1G8CFP9_9VIBR|nr:hypothetical protein SAMN04488136_11646 [Vibrio xiamenensis]